MIKGFHISADPFPQGDAVNLLVLQDGFWDVPATRDTCSLDSDSVHIRGGRVLSWALIDLRWRFSLTQHR